MAHALVLSDELLARFAQAHDRSSVSTRWLQIDISNETFVVTRAFPASVNARADFDRLQAQAAPASASFYVFCTAPHAWVFLAYVPDTCPVHERMRYASARASLKKGLLGPKAFAREFQVSSKADLLALDASLGGRENDAHDAPWTEAEKLVREESRMERDMRVKSSAMGILPFPLSEALERALGRLNHDTLWIEMVLENESVQLSKTLIADLKECVAQIDSEKPCFIAYRDTNGHKCFIFFCPENAPTKMKMVYSSAKATILASASDHGLTFDRTIEIHHNEDYLHEILGASSSDVMSPPRPDSFSKPAPPGKRRPGSRRPKAFVPV